jgi:hypothetical protein
MYLLDKVLQNHLKWDCTTADASPAAADFFITLRTAFEGQNLQYLKIWNC